MSTINRRGRKPAKFYRGRIPNANLEFLNSQRGNELFQIQKAYHDQYGAWLRISTIESTLNRMAKKTNSENQTKNTDKSNNISININYNGRGYTLKQYTELIRVETRKEIASQLSNG